MCTLLVENFGGAANEIANYADHAAKSDLVAKVHSASMGISLDLAAVQDKHDSAGGVDAQIQKELEAHMRSLSRRIAKARSTSMREGANAEHLSKENYDGCEAIFNTIAAELLNTVKKKASPVSEDAQKLDRRLQGSQ